MTGNEAPKRHLRSTSASLVAMRRIQWLWDQRIVLAGLTLLAGREGLGKSTIAMDITAKITLGRLAGEREGTPRSVIYINSEDARDYTIVPRLVAAGADLGRVFFLDAVTPCEGREAIESQLVLPLDDDLLAEAIREHDAALVVLDAATSVIDSRLDGDKDRQMRQGLERIARIGQTTGAAVLGIVHFGKRESSDTGKLILGSIAWSQVARSVLAVALDEEESNLVLSTTKGNLGPGAPSLTAHIISATVDTPEGPADVGRVEWIGETDRHARDLLGGDTDANDRSERDEAKTWLLDYLKSHGTEAPAGEIIGAAIKAGFAKHTVQRARKKAGVESRKGSMDTGWVWATRPEGDTEDDEGDTKNARARISSPSSPSRHPLSSSGRPTDSDNVLQLHRSPGPGQPA